MITPKVGEWIECKDGWKMPENIIGIDHCYIPEGEKPKTSTVLVYTEDFFVGFAYRVWSKGYFRWVKDDNYCKSLPNPDFDVNKIQAWYPLPYPLPFF